ncbi:MAG: M23 family metallopeptidase [Bacteroidota bacterium]
MFSKVRNSLSLIIVITVVFFSCVEKQTPVTQELDNSKDSVEVAYVEPTLLYGIAIDSFEVSTSKVRWSQSLAEILSDYNITNEKIYQLAHSSKGIFDVRKIKANSPYTIIHEKDSLKTARQLIYEDDATRYVVFNLADSVYVYSHEKPVIVEERTLAASISTSVYESVLENDAPPILVGRLVDIFAWQVDFFRIQKGDEFKVIYEEQRVDDEVIGVGKIKGAYFKHFDKEYYAIKFDQGGEVDYFDEDGNSLRKTFLRSPLDFYRISSRFNPRRYHPVLKSYRAHLGTDYAAPTGTPIRTVGDGVVLEATYHGGNGNYVKIKHNSNYTTQYLHMSRIARGIKPGTTVKQGQTIGYVGQTGLANGPHVCFRFWKNGRQVDALKVDLPPSEPIDPGKKTDFLHTKNVIVDRLEKIEIPSDKHLLAQIPVN